MAKNNPVPTTNIPSHRENLSTLVRGALNKGNAFAREKRLASALEEYDEIIGFVKELKILAKEAASVD